MANTAVEFSELIGQYVDDVFSPLPSSPEQAAVFSPGACFDDVDDSTVEYFNSFELKSHSNGNLKVIEQPQPQPQQQQQQSLKRKASGSFASVPELPRKKQVTVEPLWPSNDPNNHHQQLVLASQQQQQQPLPSSSTLQHLQQLQNLQQQISQHQQLQLQPATIAIQPASITPSRIKSTTPNIKLLFSLFDVLENDDDDEVVEQQPINSFTTNTITTTPLTLTTLSSRSPSPSPSSYSDSPSPRASSLSPSSSPYLSPVPYYEEQASSPSSTPTFSSSSSPNVIYINTKMGGQNDYSSSASPTNSDHCVPEFDSSSPFTNSPLSFSPTNPFSSNLTIANLPWIQAGQY